LPHVISDTSPIQYLHQLGELRLLPTLVGTVIVPPAVVAEVATGRARGIDLPDLEALDWISVRSPISTAAMPVVSNLGPGETEVLALALESDDAVAILDDGLARQIAQALGIRIIGTLGVLLDGKKAGLIPSLGPVMDRLQALRFRLSPATRVAVLHIAGESP
jgi:predicted nucleic acid-binding protein